MSDTAAKKKIRLRRNIVRAALILVYLGLMTLVFVQGKGHTILIDNKDSGDYKALEGIRVAVDRGADSEYLAGDRDMAKVKGQVHRVIIDRQDGSPKMEKTIRLPLGADTVLLSLPKLMAGAEPYLEPFQIKAAAAPEEEALPLAADALPGPEGAVSPAPAQGAASQPAASSGTSSEDSGDAVFYSEPGGQGTATTDSSSKGADASSSDDSGEAVFYSEPGGEGTATH